jgi:hypothetical protein
MTLGLVLMGSFDIVRGLALRPAAALGRLFLIAAGINGLVVAANPEPAGGGSVPHVAGAAAGCVAMSLWAAGAPSGGDVGFSRY